MSIMKFKRILRILITDFFLHNEFFYVHSTPIELVSYKEFKRKLHDQVT